MYLLPELVYAAGFPSVVVQSVFFITKLVPVFVLSPLPKLLVLDCNDLDTEPDLFLRVLMEEKQNSCCHLSTSLQLAVAR